MGRVEHLFDGLYSARVRCQRAQGLWKQHLLGSTPKLDDLDKIVASSLAWERGTRYGA
jgi:hypothetical protein